MLIEQIVSSNFPDFITLLHRENLPYFFTTIYESPCILRYVNTSNSSAVQDQMFNSCCSFQLKILASDEGTPSRTASATIFVTVQDVNDNAPVFSRDYRPVVREGEPGTRVVELVANDTDDASRGNGPPFTFSMDPKADDILKASFKVENIPRK